MILLLAYLSLAYMVVAVVVYVYLLLHQVKKFQITITLRSLFSGFYDDCLIMALLWFFTFFYCFMNSITYGSLDKIADYPLKKFKDT